MPWLAVALAACGADGDAMGLGADGDRDVERSEVGRDTSPIDLGEPSGCSPEVCGAYACNTDFEACRTHCEGPEHCLEGYVCQAGLCVGTTCTEANARAACGPYACVRGECATTCGSGGCAGDYYCRGDLQRCVPRCTERDDARCEGFVCDTVVGECEPYCHEGEIECATGYVCDPDDRCVPVSR